MKRIFSIVGALLFINIAFSQNDYQPGFIITNENDTAYGIIEYGISRQFNFSTCRFKQNETQQLQEYSPQDIKAYRILDNKFYISKNIPINDTSKTVFVECLVDGAVDLYYYFENLKDIYYIEKEDGEIYALETETNTVKKDYMTYELNSNIYKGVLTYALSDCKEIKSSINTVSLNHKSMINLSKKYHEYICDGEKCIVYEKQKKQNLDFGLFISYNLIYYNLIEANFGSYGYHVPKLDNASSPGIGLIIDYKPSFGNNKIMFSIQTEYFSTKFNEIHSDDFDEDYVYKYIKTSNWYNSVLIKYKYPSKNVQPVLFVGPSCNFVKVTDKLLQPHATTLPISSIMGGADIGSGIEYSIKDKLDVFINLTYSLQFGVYNYYSYLKLKTGFKF